MSKFTCAISDCLDPVVGRVVTVTSDECSASWWLCAEHLVDEAEQVRDDPAFYGLGAP